MFEDIPKRKKMEKVNEIIREDAEMNHVEAQRPSLSELPSPLSPPYTHAHILSRSLSLSLSHTHTNATELTDQQIEASIMHTHAHTHSHAHPDARMHPLTHTQRNPS